MKYLICILLTSFIFIIYIILYKRKLIKREKQRIDWEVNNYKNEQINKVNKEVSNEILKLNNIFEEKQNFTNKTISHFEDEIKRAQEHQQILIQQEKDIVNKEINHYKEEEYKRIQKETENYLKLTDERIGLLMNEMCQISLELEDYKAKQAQINEAIQREKEIKENETFYKINLSKDDINDMLILKDVGRKINNHEAIAKLIYDVYISRPLHEMEKRVLNGKQPSGIYKITYLPTGESYIGKSTNVKTRWDNHLKTVCGLDGAAHQTVHTAMQEKGIQNFSFELLEEVSKDKLSEREKFWIEFYNTKEQGMNMRLG